MTSELSPYPIGVWYAVHKGFVPNVYESYHLLNAQIRGFEDAQFEVFATRQDAEHYVQTGFVPDGVTPLVPNEPGGRSASAATPTTSFQPAPSIRPPSRPARTTGAPAPAASCLVPANRSTTSVFRPLEPAQPIPTPSIGIEATASASATSSPNHTRAPPISPTRAVPGQPSAMPSTPKKGKLVTTSEADEEGDTEPEEDVDEILGPRTRTDRRTPSRAVQRTPTAGSASVSKPAPLGRTPTPGSLAAILRRSRGAGDILPKVADAASVASAPLATSTAVIPTPIIHSSTASTKPINASPTQKAKANPTPATATSSPFPMTALANATPSAQEPISRLSPQQVHPEAGQSKPRAGARFRDCTHCDGTGRVPIPGSDTDTSYEGFGGAGGRSAIRKRTGSIGAGGHPRKRLSDSRKHGETRRNRQTDKGKGKERGSDSEVNAIG